MPSTQLQQVVAHLKRLAARAAAARVEPIPTQLEVLRQIVEEYAAVDPSATQVTARAIPCAAAGRSAEWLLAESSRPDCRLLYLHGGSWMKGSLASHRALAARIAQAAGCAVLTLDYRLAPENPFPAGLEDCAAAFQWMRAHGPDGLQPAHATWIAGDSAGGNLTLATLLLAKERQLPQPCGAIALSPSVDFTFSGNTMRTQAKIDPVLVPESLPICAAAYLQHGEDLRNPLASPLYGDLQGLPPLLIQVGTAEILLDDSRNMAAAAQQAGVDVTLEVWPQMPHVFQIFAPFLPEASEALHQIGAFVRNREP